MQIDRERLALIVARAAVGPEAVNPHHNDKLAVDAILADIEAQGFVVAPKEPTEVAVEAACRTEAEHQGFHYDQVSIGEIQTAKESCRRVWRFLIDAAKEERG